MNTGGLVAAGTVLRSTAYRRYVTPDYGSVDW